jgi:Arc/MetJ-type ribon-helix-helix transcriptional regulator
VVKKLMATKYRNVSIPADLYEKLQELVKSGKGYVSVSDCVKDAIRDTLRKYNLLP